MMGLVAKSGVELVEKVKGEFDGENTKATFDPLMSINYHFTGEALRCGGVYLMGQDPSGANEGHYCPVCEFEKNSKGFEAEKSINSVADQMLEWCRTEGLLPKVQ